jgi:hypothetical protein
MPSVSVDLVRLLAGLTAEQKSELREKLGSEAGKADEADRERLRRARGEAARKRREARLAFAG